MSLEAPASVMVGTSGRTEKRLSDPTASARRRPSLMKPCTAGTAAMVTSTSPATTACAAGEAPLYGTCVRLMPIFWFSASRFNCAMLPTPKLA